MPRKLRLSTKLCDVGDIEFVWDIKMRECEESGCYILACSHVLSIWSLMMSGLLHLDIRDLDSLNDVVAFSSK